MSDNEKTTESGRLESDPLFLGLTRPAVILGVSYVWFALEGAVWAIFFINTSNIPLMLVGAGVTHISGFVLFSKEPYFMDVFMVWAKTNTKCSNTQFHGNTSSYDIF